MKTDQKTLKKLVQRRHPEYLARLPHWKFLLDCYEGGREWFADNIFKYLKEGETEHADRLKRAYRFNHTREVVDLVDKYIFKMEVARNESDAPQTVKDFWKSSTLNGLTIKDYVKQISKLTSIYGRLWVVVDNSNTGDITTIADEKKAGVKTYSYLVTPENACDMSYDDNGELNWILIHEQVRDDDNPLESSGDMIDRYRLWERNQWTLFTIKRDSRTKTAKAKIQLDVATDSNGDAIKGAKARVLGADIAAADVDSKIEVTIDGPHPHGFGAVPVFPADSIIGHELYSSPALIDDVAYLDRAVANYLSNLDAIIQDQTFSQLVMPAQGVTLGDSTYDKLVEMGTKRVFTYDAEGGGKPEYISPDVKQAELVLQVINKIISEIYHSVGLAGERTKDDNSAGIDNSSGVAKAYDFERVNSLLAAKADSLELIENKLTQFVTKWSGESLPEKALVSYPDNFDVRGLYDEFEIAARLQLISAPDGVRRYQMEFVIDKLFPQLAQDLRAKMIKELVEWPIDPIQQAQEMAKASGGDLVGSTGKQNVGGKNDRPVNPNDKKSGDQSEQKQVKSKTSEK